MITKYSTLERRAELRGEFWLIGGQAAFADGDVGDFNHEGMVIQQLMAELADDVNTEIGSRMDTEYADLTKIEYEIEKYLDSEVDKDDTETPHPERDKIHEFILETIGYDKDKFDVLLGNVDARDYGLKHLGWVRVKTNEIQTWQLTPEEMKDIARGLADAYNEDVESDTYNIEVSSNGKYYTGVPYSVLESGNPASLREYQHIY
jgi:flagellar hook-associated protein FlgK